MAMALAMAMAMAMAFADDYEVEKEKNMKNKNDLINHRPVLIFTDLRAVFFGFVDNEGPSNEEMLGPNKKITVKRLQHVLKWTREVNGSLGLAVDGPDEDSNVTKACISGSIVGTHAVYDCTEKAVKAFEARA